MSRYTYRVFVSYSHDDAEQADIVREHLMRIGAQPMSDVNLPPGASFAQEIKRRISCAHVFIPLLTARSKKRPWVHQEIGYAMGMGVPVLPLALDELPKGMAEHIHAMSVLPDLSDLDHRLDRRQLDFVVRQSQDAGLARFETARRATHRTRALVEHSRDAYEAHGPARVRQSSAFSSFSLPRRGPKHRRWQRRNPGADAESIRLLRDERRTMEDHARQGGCDLVLDPYVMLRPPGPDHEGPVGLDALAVRVEVLLEFLESMTDDMLRVVIRRGEIEGSLVLVGDLFLAEAVAPYYGGGYRQTTFTWHAPTVLARAQEFDDDFQDHLDEADLSGRSSRQVAIDELNDLLRTCKEGPLPPPLDGDGPDHSGR